MAIEPVVPPLDDGALQGGDALQANPLSEREREVARLLATGASNAEIARDLVISPHTVKVHLRNIFEKLQVSSRTEATMLLVQRGWIVVPGMVRSDEGERDESLAAPELPPLADLPAPVHGWQRLFLLAALLLALALVALPLWQSPVRSSPPLLSDAEVRGAAPQMNTDARWELLAPLPTARSRHAVALATDQLIVFGGETTGGRLLSSVSGYDLTTNRWQELEPMPLAVSNLSATLLGDQIYVAGGTVEPVGAPLRPADMRRDPVNLLWRYDPAANRWFEAGVLPVTLAGATLATDGGALYLVGGWDGTQMRDEIWRLVLDPARTVGLNPAPPTEPAPAATSPLTTAAATEATSAGATAAPAAGVETGAAASAAGTPAEQAASPLRSPAPAATRATPATRSATPTRTATPTALPSPTATTAVTTVAEPTAVMPAEPFAAGEWEVVARLPSARAFLGAVVAENRLYVAGGFDGRRELADADFLALDSRRWEQLPAMMVARSGFSLAFDGVALVALGGGWLDTVVEHERLDPAINVWTLFDSPLDGSWRHLGAASAQGHIYLVGGWSGDYLGAFVQYQSTFRAWLPVITNE